MILVLLINNVKENNNIFFSILDTVIGKGRGHGPFDTYSISDQERGNDYGSL
jgi:hypothetical protein